MTREEKDAVGRWLAGEPGHPRMVLHLTQDPRSGLFEAFCEAFGGLAPCVSLIVEREASPGPPGLSIGKAILYRAIPLQREFAPFLKALTLAAGGAPDLLPGEAAHVREVRLPASLRLFVTPQCPHCPAVVERLVSLSACNPLVSLTVIDGLLFPESAREAGVQTAPTVLFEGLRWTGPPPMADLLQALIARDPACLGPDSFAGMIREGKALDLTRMMLERQRLFPGCLPLLSSPEFSVRLGAMAALESLLEASPGLGAGIPEHLWASYPQVDRTLQGDLLYMIGVAGGPDDLSKLSAAAEEAADAEVREAAMEALSGIRTRLGI